MTTSFESDQMIAIAAGEVTLNDRRTRRRWTVELTRYSLAAIPVTQAQYADVTGSSPSATRGDGLPVESVSWLDAVSFCNALSTRHGRAPAYDVVGDAVSCDGSADGYRLPTEGEWEHACRAGTLGARYGALDEIAWFRDNSYDRLHAVGGKRPNAWGLHDMLGNVWEWCWDIYDAEAYGDYRVLRGGGWSDPEWSCRAGARRRSHPSFRIEDLGFRVAHRDVSSPGATER
jgi:formylglycine-generating enzyme required for sulfatase activity